MQTHIDKDRKPLCMKNDLICMKTDSNGLPLIQLHASILHLFSPCSSLTEPFTVPYTIFSISIGSFITYIFFVLHNSGEKDHIRWGNIRAWMLFRFGLVLHRDSFRAAASWNNKLEPM